MRIQAPPSCSPNTSLGWISALPLVAWLVLRPGRHSPVLLGTLYGIGYYMVVNALALPIHFGDRLPWTLGIATVLPSLIVHVVFGAVIGFMCRRMGPLQEQRLPRA